ncbi:MAG: CAP domain-containing protein [Planctomycetota bacterium]|jgi:uncharacterized protein YkwD
MLRQNFFPRAALAAFFVGAVLCGPVSADVVHSSGGGRFVGEIISEEEDGIRIVTKIGEVLVPWEDVEDVVRGPVPESERPKPRPVVDTEAKKAPKKPRKPKAKKPKAAAPDAAADTETLTPDEAIQEAIRGVRSRRAETREAAMKKLSATEAGRAALHKELTKELAKAEKAVHSFVKMRQAKLQATLIALVVERRRAAYAFIMDPSKYPDANHGAAAQPEVDKLVEALRRAYLFPFDELVQTSDDFKERLAAMKAIQDAAKQYLGSQSGHLVDPTRRQKIRDAVNKKLSLEGKPFNPTERQNLEKSAEAQRFNKKLASELDPEEIACTESTNRYRMLFGLPALKTDLRLVKASRGHSTDMAEHKFFDHTSPVPGKRTPEIRCRLEGAQFSGENIAMGSGAGHSTFLQWYNSSGHHRNILTKSIGKHKRHWTQLCGMDSL